MAKLTLGGGIEVTTKITKTELMDALRSITINDRDFNPDVWSLGDAEDLMRAGAMIRREIIESDPERYAKLTDLPVLNNRERGTETCDAQVRGSCRSSELQRIWWCPECLARP